MTVSEDLLDLLGCMAEDDGFLPHESAIRFIDPGQLRAAVMSGLVVSATRRAPVTSSNPILNLLVTWRYDGYALTERGQALGDIGRRMRLSPHLHQQGEIPDPAQAAHLRRLYVIEAEDHLGRL
jgi:hypothetical protein